jgi:hypothetical protein
VYIYKGSSDSDFSEANMPNTKTASVFDFLSTLFDTSKQISQSTIPYSNPKFKKYTMGRNTKMAYVFHYVRNKPQLAASSADCRGSSLSTAEIKIERAECITSSVER